MFASKARAYPRALNEAGKACQGQTLQLIMDNCKLNLSKSVIIFGPGDSSLKGQDLTTFTIR
jgi:hypothetical protein